MESAACAHLRMGNPVSAARHPHRLVTVKTYKPLPSITGIPGLFLCKNCLRSERKAALDKELVDAALSGDEVDE